MNSVEFYRRVRSFDAVLLETMDDVLKQVFGEGPSKIIFQHAKKGASLRREEIPERVNVLDDSLRVIFGSGSVIVEDLILKSLYFKLELKFEEKKGYEFRDYIKELRRIEIPPREQL